MKNWILLALVCALTQTVSAQTIAERHMAQGVKCEACHLQADKSVPVRKQACLQCHKSYAALAEKTKNDHPNPHFNHYGERDCSVCHKGHQPSTLVCNQCHKFDLKMP